MCGKSRNAGSLETDSDRVGGRLKACSTVTTELVDCGSQERPRLLPPCPWDPAAPSLGKAEGGEDAGAGPGGRRRRPLCGQTRRPRNSATGTLMPSAPLHCSSHLLLFNIQKYKSNNEQSPSHVPSPRLGPALPGSLIPSVGLVAVSSYFIPEMV